MSARLRDVGSASAGTARNLAEAVAGVNHGPVEVTGNDEGRGCNVSRAPVEFVPGSLIFEK